MKLEIIKFMSSGKDHVLGERERAPKSPCCGPGPRKTQKKTVQNQNLWAQLWDRKALLRELGWSRWAAIFDPRAHAGTKRERTGCAVRVHGGEVGNGGLRERWKQESTDSSWLEIGSDKALIPTPL